MQSSETSLYFMKRAIELSTAALGHTMENPAVGAVITKMIHGSEIIIGEGATAPGGRPHAETLAFADALQRGYKQEDFFGSAMYVTLEPCAHYGKTPPCALAIQKAGIKKIFIALKDIDKRVEGRGVLLLKEAGIEVHLGLLAQEAYGVLASYFVNKLHRRSYVTLKLAQGKDSVIGSQTMGNVPISNLCARNLSHELRYQHDAILVGINTVLLDDPSLTCRLPNRAKDNLVRIVLDSNLHINIHSKLVQSARQQPVIIICLHQALEAKKKELMNYGVNILEVANLFDINYLLNLLYKQNIRSILVEGGANVAKTFMKSGCVDSYALFTSPIIVEKAPVYAPIEIPKDYLLIKQVKIEDNIYRQWLRREKCLQV